MEVVFKMKKIISLLLVLVMVAAVFTGCSKPAEDDVVDTPPVVDTPGEDTEEPADDAGAEGEIVKFGLGQNISIKSSKEKSEDANAQSQADVTMAAVGFDKDGKVVSVTIDTVQAKVAFDEEMKITSDLEAEVLSKKDLKDDYGMKGVSASIGIGKEWFEQMDAFEEWMIGKTADEIVNVPVKERDESHKNVPDVPELTSTVTITVEGYLAAVEEAWANAVDVEGGATVGLGVKAGIGSSKELGTNDNGEEVLPQTQADVYMSATAFDADGKVVGTVIDTAQVKVAYDAEGKITSDMEAELKTKHELKEDYGMKGVSTSIGIGKEWYEQMEAFQEWMVGKTVDEIVNLPVKERDASHLNVPDVPELTSTVTITVEGYLAVVEEAAANAR